MGFRFQRRIKIAPGVRVNISKSGVSTSIGPRGASVTVGKRGVRAHVGIPGTGLSYSEQLTKKRRPAGKSAGTGASRPAASRTAAGDPAALKEVAAYTAYVNLLRTVHLETVPPVDWAALAADSPAISGDGPKAEIARRTLEAYKPSWVSRLFRREAAERQVLEQALTDAEAADAAQVKEREKLQRLAERVLAGDRDAQEEALGRFGAFGEVRSFGNTVRVQLTGASPVLYVEIIGEDTVPAEVLSLTAKGTLSRKVMGKTNYHALYQDYVCSCLISAVRDLFAVVPSDEVLVHVYGMGQADEPPVKGCLVSARIERAALDDVFLDLADSSEFVNAAEHHMNHLKTKGFRLVEELA
ncbi:DUF4236 domain-containing protein [Sporosarcina sp. NCCP-2716]|uniref:DUF4236 domain-containing protein n=1 Tax=Sporosarcina sp. NCCP-2716 TaxID=2943679 RepID=UPI00203E0DFA|nr:DUF4236 domain-containing protein [Sporosarcina sp. NCCP-2716]